MATLGQLGMQRVNIIVVDLGLGDITKGDIKEVDQYRVGIFRITYGSGRDTRET